MREGLHPHILKRISKAIELSQSMDEFKTSHAYQTYLHENEDWVERVQDHLGEGVLGEIDWINTGLLEGEA